MQAFDYLSPSTIEQAVAVLNREGDQARALAGGTDLIVQLREGRRSAKFVVDIKKIPALNEIKYESGKDLVVGASVPCATLARHAGIRKDFAGVVDGFSLIGGTAIQSRATIGGNLCTASPAGDAIPSLIAHNAVCTIAGVNGYREVKAEDFCIAPGKSCLQRGELLVSVRVPAASAGFGAGYLRFIPRNEMDIAVASAALAVVLNGDVIQSARVVLGAVAPTPLLAHEAAAMLTGKKVGDAKAVEAAMTAAREAAKPITDMRGTAEQRKHLVGVLLQRALDIAVNRAQS